MHLLRGALQLPTFLWVTYSLLNTVADKRLGGGAGNAQVNLGSWSLIKRLVLFIFAYQKDQWDVFCASICRVLKTIERQGYKDLGLVPCENVWQHISELETLVAEIAREKGWSEEKVVLTRLIAKIHDFVEAWGYDVPIIKVKLPFRRVDRIVWQIENVKPATLEEERQRLLKEYPEERQIMRWYLNGSDLRHELIWAILWCFDRYYLGDTDEGVLVQQAHYLQTVCKAKSYENRRNPGFAQKHGSEPFFVRVESVITDPHVHARFVQAREQTVACVS